MLRSRFSPETRSVMDPRFGFFPDSRIRVKDVHRIMQNPLYSLEPPWSLNLEGHILLRKNSTFYAHLVRYSDVLNHTACENE